MAIRMRRGNYSDFDPTKMTAGEFAICLDNGYVYATLSPGNVVRLGTAETIEQALALARQYAEDSEAWAVGQRDGEDVPSTDDTYHNNAKYYSDRAYIIEGEVQELLDNFEDKIPTATVTREAGNNYATVTITDQNGTTTANIYDGAKGEKGDKGDKGEKGDSGSGSGDMLKSEYDANSDIANAGGIKAYVDAHSSGDVDTLIRDTVGWTGKNLLPYPVGTRQVIASDGTITDNSAMYLSDYIEIDAENVTFSVGSKTGEVYCRLAFYTDAKVFISRPSSDGTFPYTSTTPNNAKYVRVCFEDGTAYVTNPMLRRADIVDDTYEPYHENVEEEIKQIYADNGVLGAKNLFDKLNAQPSADEIVVTQTNDGIRGVVASASTWKSITVILPNIKNKDLILSSFAEITSGRALLRVDGTDLTTYTEIKEGTGTTSSGELELDFNSGNYEYLRIQLYVTGGSDYSTGDITYKNTMLRLASDPDDTYVPYSMTNKELTENINGKQDALTAGENITIENNVISATGGSGASTWSGVQDKPFDTIDTDVFSINDAKLSLPVPTYYVEVDGNALAGYYQTADEPIVLPDGALSKPFDLVIKNIGVYSETDSTKRKLWRTNNCRLYVKEKSWEQANYINISRHWPDQYNSSQLADSVRYGNIKLELSRTLTSALGSSVRLHYDPYYSVINKNAIFVDWSYVRTPGTYQFQDGITGDTVDGETCSLNSTTTDAYILTTYEFTAATGAYRGHHMWYIVCPYANDAYVKPIGIQIAGSSASGVTVTYLLTDGTPQINIKPSATAYEVSYSVCSINYVPAYVG